MLGDDGHQGRNWSLVSFCSNSPSQGSFPDCVVGFFLRGASLQKGASMNSFLKSGSIELSSGISSLVVTDLDLPFTPTQFTVSIKKAAESDPNLYAFLYGAISSDGFSVEFSSVTELDTYTLEWTAIASSTTFDTTGTTAVTYTDLVDSVRRFLGYGSTLTADQTTEVDGYIQAGVRQFYYPPATENVQTGYRWSFLNPSETLSTVIGTDEYTLPVDFGRIIGSIRFNSTAHMPSIAPISIGQLYSLRDTRPESGVPKYATFDYASTFGVNGQLQKMSLWPNPDAEYVLNYRYEAYSGKLDATSRPFPLGGAQYANVIIESCLSIAEQRANDEIGLHTTQFKLALASAVEYDRRHNPVNFGQLGDQNSTIFGDAGLRSELKEVSITYKGSPI